MKFAASRIVLCFVIISNSVHITECSGQEKAEEFDSARFQKIADRYWKILSRRPRRGTSFDLWYRHYLDAGKLADLYDRVRSEAEKNPNDAAQVLLGLVQERRGEDEAAIVSYESAIKLVPNDYYPLSLVGSLHARRFEFEKAVDALSKAVELEPPRTELLDMYKNLGQMQLRQGEIEVALATWERVAKEFPKDRRVLIELATLLASEDQFDEAIRRWEEVIELSAKNPYEQLKARIEIGQLYALSGKRQSAVSLFNKILDGVKPDSWAAKDVRKRVEDVYLKHSDFEGLIEYCEKRLTNDPDDLESMQLLAQTYAKTRKHDEALATLRKALKLAPSRRDLREELIQQFVRMRQFSNAIEECDALVAKHPTDVELLQLLGDLHLEAVSVFAERAERQQAESMAADVWERIAKIRPDDANLAVQVAEACRRAAQIARRDNDSSFEAPMSVRTESPLVAKAEEYYREAIRRNENELQYYEYLGEFLHSVDRRDEAVKVWSSMVNGPRGTADAWHRLAEVYSGFGYLGEAVKAGRKSLELDSQNFEFQDLQIRLLVDKEEFDKAVQQLDRLDELAEDPLMEERALDRRVIVLSDAGRAMAEIQRLQQLSTSGKATLKDAWLLGRLLADRWRFGDAANSFKTALTKAPNDNRILQDYVLVLERAGDTQEAVTVYRQLAGRMNKDRSRFYERIVDLELRQGHAQEAIQAADQLAKLSPSNIDAYLLQASVAFRLGKPEDGLDTLRRAVRVAPRDRQIRGRLAEALSENGHYKESMEHYWRCFDLAEEVGEKISYVAALADVSIKLSKTLGSINSDDYDQFISELKRRRDRHEEPRELTLCLVEAFRMNNRYKEARKELEGLLTDRRDDLDVLQTAVSLAAAQKDWKVAVGYQSRMVAIDASREHLRSLSQFHLKVGNQDEAKKVWKRILEETDDATPIVRAIDGHMRAAKFEEASKLAEWGLGIAPDNWHLLYRSGYAMFTLEKNTEAMRRFTKFYEVAEQRLANQAPRKRQRKFGSRGGTSSSRRTVAAVANMSLIQRLPAFQDIYSTLLVHSKLQSLKSLKDQLKRASSSRKRNYLRSLSNAIQVPSSLSGARTSSVVAMMILAQRQNRQEAWFSHLREQAKDDATKLRELVLVQAATGTLKEFDVADQLAQLDPDNELPHTAKFYLRSNNATSTYNEMSVDQKIKRMASLRHSFQWIDQNRPDLRADVLYNYGLQLAWLGDPKVATDLVRTEMNAAGRLEELGNLPSLVFQINATEFYTEFLTRLSKLADESPVTSVNHLAGILQLIISQPFSRFNNEDQLRPIVSTFDRYLALSAEANAASSASGVPYLTNMPVRSGTFRSTTRRTTSMTAAQRQMLAVQQQIYQAQIQPLMTEYRNVTQQIAALQNNPKKKTELTARRNKLLATIQTMSRQRSQNSVAFFPAPTQYLPVQSHVILQQFVERLKTIKQADVLLQTLTVRANQTKEREQKLYQMARISTLWWTNERAESIKSLQAFCDTVPNDHRLRFALAQAALVTRDPAVSLKELNKVKTTKDIKSISNSAIFEQQATALRTSIWQSVASSGDKAIYDTVMIELLSPSNRQLGILFVDPSQIAKASRTTRRTTSRRTTTIRPTTPKPPSSRAPVVFKSGTSVLKAGSVSNYGEKLAITKLLTFAHNRDTLPGTSNDYLGALDKRAAAKLTQHPKNFDLAALVTLVRLKEGLGVAALQSGEQMWDVIQGDPKMAGSVQATLVTIACLKNAETRSLGYRLSLTSSKAQLGRVESLKVLTTSTSAFVADGRIDEAKKLLVELFQNIDKIPTSSKVSPDDKLYQMADLLPAIHASLLPMAVGELAQRFAKARTVIRYPQRLVSPIHVALTAGMADLKPEDRKGVLQQLLAMLFPIGKTGDAHLLWWQNGRGTLVTSSLGKVVIDLAKSCDELPKLRETWNAHPLQTSANIFALRIEAAVATKDEKETERLLAEIPEFNRRIKGNVPVWSTRCRQASFPERASAEWVLSQGIGASVILSPGGIIMQASDLPSKDFAIRSIVLTGRPKVTNDSLKNLARLHKLETLDLSKTKISDSGLVHLKDLSNLQSMSLSNTNVTDKGLKHLTTLENLTFLKLQNTQVTDAGIEYMKKVMPKCRILR